VEDEIAPKENAANDQCTGAGAGIEEDARAGDKECGSSYISEPRVSGDPRNYRNHDRMKSSGEGLRRHVGAHQVLNAQRSDRDAEYSPAPLGNSIQETLHRRGLLQRSLRVRVESIGEGRGRRLVEEQDGCTKRLAHTNNPLSQLRGAPYRPSHSLRA